jgi:hypothetical protein
MTTAKIGSSTSRPRCKKGDFPFIGNTVGRLKKAGLDNSWASISVASHHRLGILDPDIEGAARLRRDGSGRS